MEALVQIVLSQYELQELVMETWRETKPTRETKGCLQLGENSPWYMQWEDEGTPKEVRVYEYE